MKFSPKSFQRKAVDSGFIEISNVSIKLDKPSLLDLHFKIYYNKQDIKHKESKS